MKLCECGCGEEVTKEGNRFIVGHCIRINNPIHNKESRKKMRESLKGFKHSEETKRKIADSKKGGKFSEEHKKKMSEAAKGNKYFLGHKHSEETKKKMSKIHMGKSHSEETKRKMRETHKGKYSKDKSPSWKGGVKEKNIALYETYAHKLAPIEEVRRIRFTELGQANMRVRCYHCKKWMIPTKTQVASRINSLKSGSDGNHFYCGDNCKESCSIFNQSKYPKGYLPPSNRPFVDPYWVEQIIERAGDKCERCNEPTSKCGPLIAHHELPATQNPITANDLGIGWAVCEQCHKEIHSKDGCKTSDLRC